MTPSRPGPLSKGGTAFAFDLGLKRDYAQIRILTLLGRVIGFQHHIDVVKRSGYRVCNTSPLRVDSGARSEPWQKLGEPVWPFRKPSKAGHSQHTRTHTSSLCSASTPSSAHPRSLLTVSMAVVLLVELFLRHTPPRTRAIPTFTAITPIFFHRLEAAGHFALGPNFFSFVPVD